MYFEHIASQDIDGGLWKLMRFFEKLKNECMV